MDENRQNPRRNEPIEGRNVNICEEPKENPESIEPKDQGMNLVEDFIEEENFSKILLEDEDWEEEELVCITT